MRGFQVAPAELEGCLLNHPDVSDVCVVGVPDDYSGEVPLAFVVLNAAAATRAADGAEAAGAVKASIKKVRSRLRLPRFALTGVCSMSQTTRWRISNSRAGSSSST